MLRLFVAAGKSPSAALMCCSARPEIPRLDPRCPHEDEEYDAMPFRSLTTRINFQSKSINFQSKIIYRGLSRVKPLTSKQIDFSEGRSISFITLVEEISFPGESSHWLVLAVVVSI